MKIKKSIVLATIFMLAMGVILFTGTVLADIEEKDDVDKDGMDDSWEQQIIKDNDLATSIDDFNATADPDNDGATNKEEYEAGTDPFDRSDSPGKEKIREKVSALVLLGVAICIGIPGIMAAIGLYIAGVAAVGMTTEHLDRFGKGLVLQALPMTQGVYGLVFAILLLLGAGFIGGTGDSALLTNVNVGWGAVMIGITIALTSVSAIPQGLVAGAGASGVGRNPDVFAKGLIYAVMPETMAVFGFLIALFILMGVGLL